MPRVGRAIALIAGLVTIAAATAMPAAAAPAAPVTVRFVASTVGGLPSVRALRRADGSLHVTGVRALGPRLAMVAVSTPASASATVGRRLAATGRLTAVSVDRRTTITGAKAPGHTVDAEFAREWDLWDAASNRRAGGFGVDAPRAWTRTLGAPGVIVAVLDTGITPHPDLDGAAQVPGYDFVSGGDGVDSGDGDGWDADPADPGDACAADDEGSSWHGTFVTGEIAAQHGVSGVAGEAPGVTIEPVRVLGSCGGTEADTIAAIEWASGGTVPDVPANANPARIISMSLGSAHRVCPAALQTAITDAIGRGSVVVAAAGNENRSVNRDSPANCAGVISVAATTRTGDLADYSNRGDATMSPTIAAPGGSDADPVLGDTWTSTGAFTAKGNQPAVEESEGTSMAAPRVAAAVALLLSVQPTLTVAQVTARLTSTATRFPKRSNCTRQLCGAGIVNAGNMVGAPGRFVHATRAQVLGSASVGRRVRADPGVWHLAPTSVHYVWYRDGTAMPEAHGRTYLLRPQDRGHRIAVLVEVQRAGVLTARAISPARRIRAPLPSRP